MRKRGAKVYCEKSKVKKHLFPTQEKAELYMQNLIMRARSIDGGLPQRVYYCESCGGWHMTSKAHIMQKHIDDGSAVLNPTPIVVEQVPESFILHEDRLQNLRKYYDSWERKCKDAQTKIEKHQIMAAKSAIEKLVKNRVRKKQSRLEKENFSDWRKRLVEKTFILQRRLNNILNGYTRKNRHVEAAPVIKCRYVPEPKTYPNPLTVIKDMKQEVEELLMYTNDPSFFECLVSKGDCYRKAKRCVRRTTRSLLRNEEYVDISIACFSFDSEPLKSVVDGYKKILAHLAPMLDLAVNEDKVRPLQRVGHIVNTVRFRLEVIMQGLSDDALEGMFRDLGLHQRYVQNCSKDDASVKAELFAS